MEVTKLANSAQRTFTFTSPATAGTITIDGHEYSVAAGESAKQLAGAINSDSHASVYAAVLEGGTVVLSSRATGNTGGEFIKVTDPTGALTEVAATAKEGANAEFKVDGVAGSSNSNTVINAIAGVTLTLGGLTPAGPVTIDVQAPGPSTGAVEAQVKSFISLYNSTVGAIQTQLATKPPQRPTNVSEFATGTLFGDVELRGLVNSMRGIMYEPIAGLESGMSSPFDIGISTGAPSGSGGTSQATLEGQLTLEPAKLTEALKTNPEGVKKMLQDWSQGLQSVVEAAGAPGGALEGRVTSDSADIKQLTTQINNMNEMLAVREKALQATFARLESVISQNNAQDAFLAKQAEAPKG